MTYHSFQSLLDAISASGLQGTPQAHFRIDPSEGFFVEPELSQKFPPAGSAVQLISARGAAGKSRTAKEISHRLHLPLWRLELDKAISATGLELNLARYLQTPDVESALRSLPRAGIVIDSLDEARTRVSTISWLEFAKSLADHVRAGLRVIALGRERTLEDLWSLLEDDDIPVDWWEISHLGASESINYVGQVALCRGENAAVTSEPYRAARDSVLDALHRSLPEADREAFVGYPPVLDAVAALLIRKPNYQAIRNQFEGAQSTEGLMAVLRRILTSLLEREQTKIQPLLQDIGIADLPLYGSAEQLDWLTHNLEGASEPAITLIDNDTHRAEYKKKLASILSEHPFRSEKVWASSVFEAYVAAERFSSGFPSDRLIKVGNHSGLLYDLLSGSTKLLADESQFAALHASLLAGQSLSTSASVQVDTDTEGAEFLDASITALQGTSVQQLDVCIIPASPGEFRLLGPLSHISINHSGRVTIPEQPSQTAIGPDFFVSCHEFHVGGQMLSVARAEGGSTATGVEIEAHSVVMPPEVAEMPRPDDLEIRVPSGVTLAYPWFAFTSERSVKDSPNDRAVRFLKMLMSLTRAHGHNGERGVFDKKLEGRQSLKRDDFEFTIAALARLGVVRRDGNMVFLCVEWEPHRFSGRPTAGQRTLEDVLPTWRPILETISEGIRN